MKTAKQIKRFIEGNCQYMGVTETSLELKKAGMIDFYIASECLAGIIKCSVLCDSKKLQKSIIIQDFLVKYNSLKDLCEQLVELQKEAERIQKILGDL